MQINREDLLALLRQFDACEPAIRWFKRTPGTPYELWRKCPRGDWLVWIASIFHADSDARFTQACVRSDAVIIPIYGNHDHVQLTKKQRESLRKCAVFVRQCIKWRTVKQALLRRMKDKV